MDAISVKKVFHVTLNAGDMKHTCTWTPIIDDIGDSSFCKVDKHDTVFQKLVLGRALPRQKRESQKNMRNPLVANSFWKKLRAARQDACDKALREALLHDDEDQPRHKRRNKEIKAKRTHAKFLPEVVEINLDGFIDAAGNVVEPTSMRIMTKEFWKERAFWVEVTQHNLSFIIQGIKTSPASENNEDDSGNDNDDDDETPDATEAHGNDGEHDEGSVTMNA